MHLHLDWRLASPRLKPGTPHRAQVLKAATGLLGKFLGMREPNIKYLGLESLMRLAEVPAVTETVDKYVTHNDLYM